MVDILTRRWYGMGFLQNLTATLEGITHDDRDTSVDILRSVTLPLVSRLCGIEDDGLELKVVRRGAAPDGGGKVCDRRRDALPGNNTMERFLGAVDCPSRSTDPNGAMDGRRPDQKDPWRGLRSQSLSTVHKQVRMPSASTGCPIVPRLEIEWSALHVDC